MSDEQDLYSTFEMDLHSTSRPPSRRLAAHVAGCMRCRAYLAELDVRAIERPEVPWCVAQSPKRWARLLAIGLAGAAMVADVALFLHGSGEAPDAGCVREERSPGA